jgi:hypothetical protein
MLHIYSVHFQSTVQLKPTVSGVHTFQETEDFRAVPNICGSPHIFTFTMLDPKPNSLRQAYKFVCRVLRSIQVAALPWSWAHTNNIPVEIHMPSTLEKAKKPQPKTKERTMNIQWGTWTSCSWHCFQDADSNKLAEAIRQGVLRMIAGSKEIVKDMKSLLTRLQYLVSSRKFQGHMHRHLYCWTMELMIHITCLQLKKKWLPLVLSFVSQI